MAYKRSMGADMSVVYSRALSSVCVLVLALSGCIGDKPKLTHFSDSGVAGDDGEGGNGGSGRAGRGGAGGAGGASGGSDGGARGGSGGAGEPPPDAGYENIAIGTPCTMDNECDSTQFCSKLAYCSTVCADDSDCGQSPEGRDNYCEADGTGRRFCFAGCDSESDCTSYSGAMCLAVSDGRGTSCTFAANDGTGAVATACDTSDQCMGDLVCIAGPGGWCSPPSCGSDDECGQAIDGVQNRCVQNNAGDAICFPGCETTAQCSYFPGAACRDSLGGDGKLCTFISVGDTCSTEDDCGSWYGCAGTPESPGWCTAECTSNDECGTGPAGYPNQCLSVTTGEGQSLQACFPGCASDDDCSIYADTVCSTEFAVCTSPN
jgi:hypothetical protein